MKKGYLKKIIKLLIIIVIPLAAAAVTASYAYNRYQDRFFNYYMSVASDENTEDRLVSYLDFINQGIEYTKKDDGYDFYYSNDFKNADGEALFTLSIIRGSEVKNEQYFNKLGTLLGYKDMYYLTYYFAVYNVNYENLAKSLDPTGEHKLLYTELPRLSIVLTDKSEDEKTQALELTTVATVTGEKNPTIIYDYGYSPKLDSKGNKLNADNPTSMRYYVLTGDKINGFTEEVDFKVEVKSNWSGDDQVTEEVGNFTLNDMYDNKDLDLEENKPVQEKIDAFNKGYDEDIFKAGYFKFAVGHYIWWECLIAFAIFELVCGGFVLVWSSEEKKENTKDKSNKKNK